MKWWRGKRRRGEVVEREDREEKIRLLVKFFFEVVEREDETNQTYRQTLKRPAFKNDFLMRTS